MMNTLHSHWWQSEVIINWHADFTLFKLHNIILLTQSSINCQQFILLFTESLQKLVKYISKRALPEAEIITEGDPVTISKLCKRPVITYFCVESMADAMKMLFVLHWICNIAYCDSTTCIFKMIEMFGNIKERINLHLATGQSNKY